MGTEPGAGWGLLSALAEFADLTVLTGSRYIEEIHAWDEAHPEAPIRFVEIRDDRLGPYTRWHRIAEFSYYVAWLYRAKRAATRLLADGSYDVAAHLTFSAFWLPAPAVSLGIPSVWGPVGGAVTTPKALRGLLGTSGKLQEVLDYVAVRTMAALPASRRTALRATQRVLQNEETRAMLPELARDRSTILNHALFSSVPQFPQVEDGRYAMWVSPMETRKGAQLALLALAQTDPSIELKMVGDGPQRKVLEQTALDLGLGDRTTFTGRIPREEVVRLMRGATTVMFTGLREEGGLALAEAMYAARRLVVLDHGGAGAVARTATDPERVALIQPGEADAVALSFAEAVEAHFADGPVADVPLIDRAAAVAELERVVREASSA